MLQTMDQQYEDWISATIEDWQNEGNNVLSFFVHVTYFSFYFSGHRTGESGPRNGDRNGKGAAILILAGGYCERISKTW